MAHGVVAGLHSAALGGVTPSGPADTIRYPDSVTRMSGSNYEQAFLSRPGTDGNRHRCHASALFEHETTVDYSDLS